MLALGTCGTCCICKVFGDRGASTVRSNGFSKALAHAGRREVNLQKLARGPTSGPSPSLVTPKDWKVRKTSTILNSEATGWREKTGGGSFQIVCKSVDISSTCSMS